VARTYAIRRADQIAALGSAARIEILDILAGLGTSSVANLAAALGRPADALYYHLRLLVRLGLVVPVGRGRGRGREEALYRAVAPRLAVVYAPGDPENARAMTRTAAALLRLGARDFRLAFRPGVAVSGPHRELWVGRIAARLTPADVARINRLLLESVRILESARASRRGRLYAWTFLLTPIDRRRKGRTK